MLYYRLIWDYVFHIHHLNCFRISFSRLSSIFYWDHLLSLSLSEATMAHSRSDVFPVLTSFANETLIMFEEN
ncbi:hypothetical protein CW304_21080 [Bacillus sp. UFRGS-B20]|nr:hypothetical protein CW304_21080 [Bacillus sp. UFRGS-B20]